MTPPTAVFGGTVEVDLGRLVDEAATAFASFVPFRPGQLGFDAHSEIGVHALVAETKELTSGVSVRRDLAPGARLDVGDGRPLLEREFGGTGVVTVTHLEQAEWFGGDAALVRGKVGREAVAVVESLVADRHGRRYSAVAKAGDAEVVDHVLRASYADVPEDVAPDRLLLPLRLLTSPGARVRERVTVSLADPANSAKVLVALSAWRDSSFDSSTAEGTPAAGRTELLDATLAGFDVPVSSSQTRPLKMAGDNGLARFATSAGKPKVAMVSAASRPAGRHFGVTVARLAVRTSLVKAPDPWELCEPFLGVASVRPDVRRDVPVAPPPPPKPPTRAPVDLGRPTFERRAVRDPVAPAREPLEAPVPREPQPKVPAPPTRASTVLAIDFGTTFTAAALRADGRTDVLSFDDGRTRVSSSVFRLPDGTLVVGEAAEAQAVVDPLSFEPTPKRRVGEDTVHLGGATVTDVDLVAAVLGHVATEARRQHGGDVDVVLSHPAEWKGLRREKLEAAAERAGLGRVRLVPEPVAAATAYAGELSAGEHVAVYDLGGGTFDAAVVRRTGEVLEVAGPPAGVDPLGGVDFDRMLLEHLGAIVAASDPEGWSKLAAPVEPQWRRHRRALQHEVRSAKEALSSHASWSVYVPGVDRSVAVTVDEFNDLIEHLVERTVDVLVQAVAAAGLQPAQLEATYLVGGSSRIPLVARKVWDRLGAAPTTYADPKLVVVQGATRC